MSRIRGKDTKPEMIVRRWLWEHGFRYRLHVRVLSGSPDIVMRRYKTVIFINGCFWHGHNAISLKDGELENSQCCKIPHSNRRFWLDKINRNMARDKANVENLRDAGWRVITVWECELRPKNRQMTLEKLLKRLEDITGRISSSREFPDDYALAAEPETAYEVGDPSLMG